MDMDNNSKNSSSRGHIDYLIESVIPFSEHRIQWRITNFKDFSPSIPVSCPSVIKLSNEHSFNMRFYKTADRILHFYLANNSNKVFRIKCDLQILSQMDQVLYKNISVFEFNSVLREKDLMDKFSEEDSNNIFNDTNVSLIIDVCLNIIGDVKSELVYEPLFTEGPKKLLKDLKHLFNSSETADVTLCVGEIKIFAHRSILCARSPVFKSMLMLPMKENKENIINIDDIIPNDFKIFLHFLYTGDLPSEEIDASALYYIADKYELLDLRNKCGNMLISKLTVSNCAQIMELAHRHEDENLKKKVLRFMRYNASSIMSTDTWKSLIASNVNLSMDVVLASYVDCTKITDISKN